MYFLCFFFLKLESLQILYELYIFLFRLKQRGKIKIGNFVFWKIFTIKILILT